MHGDADADDVGYQYEIAVGMRGVGAVFPFEDEPEHQGGAEGGEGVDLTLHGGEPEGVAPAVGQRAYEGAAHYGDILLY